VLPRAIEAAGGTAIMQPSGHGFIKTAIIDRQADLGVEVSGHHFFGGDLQGGDDGLLTALIVCRLIRQSGRPLSHWIAPFPWPAITPDLRIRYDGDVRAAVETLAAECGGRLDRMDGVRAEYETGWALARASITEPAITLRFEGRDWQQTREIAGRFLAALPELRNQVLEMIDG
jgi:phosphomannomutase